MSALLALTTCPVPWWHACAEAREAALSEQMMVLREDLSEARAALEVMCSQATSAAEASSERIATLEVQLQELQHVNGSLLHSVEQRLDTDTGAGAWESGRELL